MKQVFNLLLLGFIVLSHSISAQNRAVFVNDVRLDDKLVSLLEQSYRVQIQNGQYWYDAVNGWWGVKGQAVSGVIMPGLNFGGQLKVNASGGRSGIFINGRQINRTELFHLQKIVGQAIVPGYYWVDAYGNAGPIGGYATVNIYQMARRGNSVYSRSFATDVGYGSNGKDFYIMGKDFSYTNF